MTKLQFESTTCTRCGGTGRMPYAAYGGVCFKCNVHGKGNGTVLTPAGRSARKLWEELTVAACTTKQAWEVEVGDTVSYKGSATRWFTVTAKDFSSNSGSVVNGHCLGSALLTSPNGTTHMVTPNSEMLVRPSVARRVEILHEVAKRRKGATLIETAVAA